MRTLYHFRGAIACILLTLAAWAYGHERMRGAELLGALAVRDSVLTVQADSLAAAKARADSAHKVKVATFTKWRTAYDTTHDTVTVERVAYVKKETADSTIRACSGALGSCELTRAIAEAQATTERERRENAERTLSTYIRADRVATVKWGAIGAAVGYGVCTFAK